MNASDDDIEVNEKFKETELKEFLSFFWTAMHNVDGPNISPSEMLTEDPEKVKFLFLFLKELIGKHLHLLKTILQEETMLMRK